MPRPLSKSEPLDRRVVLRVSQRTAVAWRAAADGAGASVSDWLRAHLQEPSGATAPALTGKKSPSAKRPTRLAPPSRTDPALLRQLAAIGNNLNQIARCMNTATVQAEPIECLGLLHSLQAIECHLERLAQSNPSKENLTC